MSNKIKMYDPWNHGDWIENHELSNFENADMVVFRGGSDVTPSYYNHTKNMNTHTDSHSDKIEHDLLVKSIKANKFLLGICKGSQWISVMAGGSLIQHMSHPGLHNVTTSDGDVLNVNSSHHQQMYPYDLPDDEYKVLAWAKQLSLVHMIQGEKQLKFPKNALDAEGLYMEPEIVWYPKIKGLGVQPHPEMSHSPKEFNDWCNKLIQKYL